MNATKFFWLKIGSIFFILMVTASLGVRWAIDPQQSIEDRNPSSIDGFGSDLPKPEPMDLSDKNIETEMKDIENSEYDLNKVDIAIAEMQQSVTPKEETQDSEAPKPEPSATPSLQIKKKNSKTKKIVEKKTKTLPNKKKKISEQSAKILKKSRTKEKHLAQKKKDARDPASQKKKKKPTKQVISD